jgi:hypothetical protein
VQAATTDAYANTRLIADAARAVGTASPLLDLGSDLYGESVRLGNGRLDVVSVIAAIEARTDVAGGPPQPDRPLVIHGRSRDHEPTHLTRRRHHLLAAAPTRPPTASRRLRPTAGPPLPR